MPDGNVREGSRTETYAEVAELCACFNLRKASRAVTNLFDEALAPVGLRSTQLVILVAIAASGPVTLTRLAKEMALDSSTLARSIGPLEREGLVERSAVKDRGRITLSVTKKGHDGLARALPLWRAAQDDLVSRLGAQAWNDLREILSATVVAAQA